MYKNLIFAKYFASNYILIVYVESGMGGMEKSIREREGMEIIFKTRREWDGSGIIIRGMGGNGMEKGVPTS